MTAPRIHLEVETAKGAHAIVVTAAQRSKRLVELLRREHLPLNTRCGQRGLCDGCVVELLSGTLVHIATGKIVTAGDKPISVRGCEHRLGEGDGVRIRIPPRSLLAYEPQVVSEFRINVPRAHDPLWQQVEIADGITSAEELCRVVASQQKRRRPVYLDPRLADSFAGQAGGQRLRVTTEYHDDRWLITNVSDKPQPAPLGVAIDIGTTTVALLLVDLANGGILAHGADFNAQIHYGEDVVTRMNLCVNDATMVGQLQDAVVQRTILPLLTSALVTTKATAAQVRCISIAGNTTMLHLLTGIDPSPMGMVPFRPVFLEHRMTPAASVRLALRDGDGVGPTLHLLPGAAAYIGADLTAGIFASGLVYDDGPSLLVDAGTNGEIILKHGDRLLGCATAAGPAFEGSGLANGIRAGDGAIGHIGFDAEPLAVRTEVIGNAAPVGICGSAYVDFLAEARRIGLISHTGRFDRAVVARARNWFIQNKYGLALRVARGQGVHDIIISELDIARLLQAKAAIAAGVLTLLHRAGLQPRDIKQLYLAGGFGMHINVPNAIACGLLPGFSPEQVQVVGNTSLAGAYLALLDSGVLDALTRIGKQLEVVELNLDPGFEDRFIEQLPLPDQAPDR
ncbi:MAG: ASKHA domain-containing protein [Verrucomicrobia bacterium]|nr:ASKHA domain-containing protein [Verrucomicrobiota bacterium]